MEKHNVVSSPLKIQIMPQLLHYLDVDNVKLKDLQGSQDTIPSIVEDPKARKLFLEATSQSLDWGTIDVYTCRASCGADSGEEAYREEFVFMQPPLSLTSSRNETPASTTDSEI